MQWRRFCKSYFILACLCVCVIFRCPSSNHPMSSPVSSGEATSYFGRPQGHTTGASTRKLTWRVGESPFLMGKSPFFAGKNTIFKRTYNIYISSFMVSFPLSNGSFLRFPTIDPMELCLGTSFLDQQFFGYLEKNCSVQQYCPNKATMFLQSWDFLEI